MGWIMECQEGKDQKPDFSSTKLPVFQNHVMHVPFAANCEKEQRKPSLSGKILAECQVQYVSNVDLRNQLVRRCSFDGSCCTTTVRSQRHSSDAK